MLESRMEVALVIVMEGETGDPPVNRSEVTDTVCDADRVREPAPLNEINGVIVVASAVEVVMFTEDSEMDTPINIRVCGGSTV